MIKNLLPAWCVGTVLLVMRILKVSLILRIDEELQLTEIFKVEDKGQISKKKF